MKILVTGGAGFIGSHLVDGLLAEGHEVRILDNLDPQVHGPGRTPPSYLNAEAEFLEGDVRDADAVARALDGVEAVFHEAAAVGVGQSMYEIARYVSVNSGGAATLLEGIVARRDRIRRVIVASSMSVYGEGAYRTADGQDAVPAPRGIEQLERHAWELCDASDRPLLPVPTREDKPLAPSSVYAVTKRDHEELFLVTGAAYGIEAVALRYFNTYGTRQALSNPYTGLLAIVSSELLNGHRPVIFEDGEQCRDFVHVGDVVQANLLALASPQAPGHVYNVGAGRAISVNQAVERLARELGSQLQPEISDKFRAGDIRHCYADIGRIERDLGYRPSVAFEDGVAELVGWVRHQSADDRLARVVGDLERRTLVR